MSAGHRVEVVALATQRNPGREQAVCSCGWQGPVRIFTDDAHRDAFRHEHYPNDPRGRRTPALR